MRSVLVVSPRFPPINAPDYQRVRMSLPYFEEFGWTPIVLSVDASYVDGLLDPMLSGTIPSSVAVVRTKALQSKYTRRMGFGDLGIRALPFLRKIGNATIRQNNIDLAYFSTTVFTAITLGPVWRRKFGIPYVIDLQDPWLSDYYDSPGAPPPPGGSFKYAISKQMARFLEPKAMRKVAHIISVSPEYPRVLLERYPSMNAEQFTVLPFGGAETDFANASALGATQNTFDQRDGNRHWVYVGRGGKDMAKALRILFCAMKAIRDRKPELFRSLRLHFVGTDYAAEHRAIKTVEPIAMECGVGDLVDEQTGRIPYFEALQTLLDSDAIMLFGSDEPGYTASKLYPCILAQRPILAVFHERSSVVEILERCKAGRSITFASGDGEETGVSDAAKQIDWLLSLPKNHKPETDWEAFRPFTAREMTRRQCEIFERCIAGG